MNRCKMSFQKCFRPKSVCVCVNVCEMIDDFFPVMDMRIGDISDFGRESSSSSREIKIRHDFP